MTTPWFDGYKADLSHSMAFASSSDCIASRDGTLGPGSIFTFKCHTEDAVHFSGRRVILPEFQCVAFGEIDALSSMVRV
jgi:hypothetical protein